MAYTLPPSVSSVSSTRVPTGTETVLFQLLGQADTEEFRELARLIR